MAKKKINFRWIFKVASAVLFIVALIIIWAIFTEKYCWSVAENMPYEESSSLVEPTERERSRGLVGQSKFYRTVRVCEENLFPIWKIVDPI